MSRSRRPRLLLGAALATILAAVAVSRLLPEASPGAPRSGAPSLRWSVAVDAWPSTLAADELGAVVITGAGEVGALSPDGAPLWRVTVAASGFHAPALSAEVVVVSAEDRVVGLDRADGAVRWTSSPGSRAGPVAVAGDVALFGTEGGDLVAVGALDGAARWSVRHPGPVWSVPAIDADAGVVVAAWGGPEPRLRAVGLDLGAPRWDSPIARFAAAPVVEGGRVVVAEGDGDRRARVVARDVSTGEEAWAVPMPASFESGIEPAVAGDDLAVVDHFGTVTVIDVETGEQRWQMALDRPVLRTRVVLTDHWVVLTTHPGEVVALDRSTGRVGRRWWPDGFPVAVTPSADGDLLLALRLVDPGRVEARRLH